VVLSRSGYTGELGYELYTPAEEAMSVWQAVLAAGKDFGLLPYGALAMQSLRVEKGYPLYGVDLSEEQTPFHVGLERWIAFGKRDFIGRDALLRLQEQGVSERWAGLVVDSPTPLKAGDRLFAVQDMSVIKDDLIEGGPDDGTPEDALTRSGLEVGRVTYSIKGHSVGKMLALGYVRVSHAYPGARLAVSVAGRIKQATVAALPFFDPGNTRLKG
jgi:aminomethyltransferase